MTLVLNGTTGVSAVDGSASTPAIQGNDTNTGVFFPAADTVAIATGGTEAIRVDSSRNVGIGTSSPDSGISSTQTVVQIQNGNVAALSMNNTGGGRKYTIYSGVAGQFAFYDVTAAAERARITSGGYFKASFDGTYESSTGTYHEFTGTTANGYTLRVRCTNATPASHYVTDLRFTAASPNNTTALFMECRDSTAARFELRSNGGLANYSGNNVNLSDRREKTNFAPAGEYLSKICAIPVQTFNYVDQNMEEDPGLTLGVVAQDVQAVAPELVMESNWGTQEEPKQRLSIYQTDLQYALMKCIQEQQALITALTARIAALEQA